ncbi:MAG: hypothetical protein M0Q94_14825 [Candidatus Cloacimonetes bacterium]|nr:hypothetical protein [Candidatus Cloacimonadota bacterium]
MAAKKIKRAHKEDTRFNGDSIIPEKTTTKPIVAINVARGTYVLTTPDRVEKIRNRYDYLTCFKK